MAFAMILLGPPGAGKGTQATYISSEFGLTHISTGDMLRGAVSEGTELGKKAKGYMDSGALVPDELIIDMLLERLAKPDCEKGYMLDGFPRTIVQAQALDKKFAQQGESIDLVLFFDSDPEIIVVRMSGRRSCPDCGAVYHVDNNPPKLKDICDACGGQLVTREDDKPETVRKRLDNYFKLTEPLVSHYRKQGLVRDIEADKPIPEIKEEVGQLMEELLGK